jgi:hypothetical protein
VSTMPRIRRAVVDENDVFQPEQAVPVIAGLRWYAGKRWGEPQPTEALAVAWSTSSQAVEIEWQHNGESFTDWISADDVRRR